MRVTCGGVLRGRSQGLAALARLGRKEPGEKLTVESKSNSQTLPCTLKQTEAARGCSRTAMTCSLAVPSEPTQGTHTGTKAHTGTRAHTRTRTHTGISGQAEKWIQQDPSQGRPHPSLRQRSARSPASANGATAECATSWDPLNTQFLDPPGPGYAAQDLNQVTVLVPALHTRASSWRRCTRAQTVAWDNNPASQGIKHLLACRRVAFRCTHMPQAAPRICKGTDNPTPQGQPHACASVP